jgi:hypothetical protein
MQISEQITTHFQYIYSDCSGISRIGIKWLKSIGCEIPEKQALLYSPDIRYMTATFFPPQEISKTLPVPEEYKNSEFFMSYNNSSDINAEGYGFILNRYENGIGECGAIL